MRSIPSPSALCFFLSLPPPSRPPALVRRWMEKCGFGLGPQPVWMTSFDVRKVRARGNERTPETFFSKQHFAGFVKATRVLFYPLK